MSSQIDSAEILRWCVLPVLDSRWRQSVPQAARRNVLPDRARPFRLPQLWEWRGGLVVSSSPNENRALTAVMAGRGVPLNARYGPAWVGYMSRPASKSARKVRDWGLRVLSQSGLPDPPLLSWRNLVATAEFLLGHYRAMPLSGYRFLLVATQHGVGVRGLIHRFQGLRIPVAYIPHAPVVDEPKYYDLPVAAVGLRGDRELEFYRENVGVSDPAVRVVGNPSTDVMDLPLPSLRSESAPILAVSPDPDDVMREMVQLLVAADVGALIVAPHPRSEIVSLKRTMPSDWTIVEGRRTLDILRDGPSCVFQRSSGVALESAMLGIPTADLRLGGEEPNYPFLRSEDVYFPVRTPGDAAQFVGAARRGDFDRSRIRDGANGWCAVDGGQAVARVNQWVSEIGAEPGPSRILDGWDPDGIAYRISPVTKFRF